jgi:DNA-directed RNA polymerase subunit RPC12/RpoP
MDDKPDLGADLLMLRGVAVVCADCGDERVFVPVDVDASGALSMEYCCTSCDAAVFLSSIHDGVRHRPQATRAAS